MHFANVFVIEKKSGVTKTKSGNKLFAQGRRIRQLAVSQCIDLSTAACISANCFHCSCRCHESAASGWDRSIPVAEIKVRITSCKLRRQEWSRDNGAKNVSKKTIACLSYIT